MAEKGGHGGVSSGRDPAPAFLRRLPSAFEKLIGLVLIAIVVVNVINATGRHLFGAGIEGAEEIMVFAMVFLVMGGSICALALRSHISVNLLPTYLTGQTLHALCLLYDLLAIGVSAVVIHASWGYVSKIGRLGTKSMALGIPMSVPHSAILLGFSAMLVVALALAYRDASALINGRPRGTGRAGP
jgi:TRAP-type C4-dicarboxylate transport system permease small subunit